jgi:hypothetical protein
MASDKSRFFRLGFLFRLTLSRWQAKVTLNNQQAKVKQVREI